MAYADTELFIHNDFKWFIADLIYEHTFNNTGKSSSNIFQCTLCNFSFLISYVIQLLNI
jgi:hypothetical protein